MRARSVPAARPPTRDAAARSSCPIMSLSQSFFFLIPHLLIPILQAMWRAASTSITMPTVSVNGSTELLSEALPHIKKPRLPPGCAG